MLGMGALAMAGLLLAQVLQGHRRWTHGLSVCTVLLLGLSLLVALGWLLVAHGPVPLSTTPLDMYPWEGSRLTVAVLLWACVGMAAAFLPKRAPPGPSSERPSAPDH